MSKSGWLDGQEHDAWRGFMSAHAAVTAELARRLSAQSQLSYQDYAVLVALTEQPGGKLRLLELGELLGWEKSRLSHHVTRMASRGLVEKRPCSTDRRGQIISVTPLGRSEIEAAAPDHVAAVRELFINKLSSTQLQELAAIARAVLGESAQSKPAD